MQKVELQIREEESAATLHPPFHVGEVNQSVSVEGSGPAAPPKTDDFSEKVIDLARTRSRLVKTNQ